MVGHLNSFSALGGGNLNKHFAKNTNARGGMLKLRFDWYISSITERSIDYVGYYTARNSLQQAVLSLL